MTDDDDVAVSPEEAARRLNADGEVLADVNGCLVRMTRTVHVVITCMRCGEAIEFRGAGNDVLRSQMVETLAPWGGIHQHPERGHA